MKKNNFIEVLVVEPNKEPYVKEVKNTLESLQDTVGGLIEYINVEDNVDLICNEEGKMNNLPFNRSIGNDVIAGTFIIAGVNLNTGETISIPKDKTKKYMSIFSLANHKKTIEYLNAEFIESSNLAYMKFIDIEDLNSNEKE